MPFFTRIPRIVQYQTAIGITTPRSDPVSRGRQKQLLATKIIGKAFRVAVMVVAFGGLCRAYGTTLTGEVPNIPLDKESTDGAIISVYIYDPDGTHTSVISPNGPTGLDQTFSFSNSLTDANGDSVFTFFGGGFTEDDGGKTSTFTWRFVQDVTPATFQPPEWNSDPIYKSMVDVTGSGGTWQVSASIPEPSTLALLGLGTLSLLARIWRRQKAKA